MRHRRSVLSVASRTSHSSRHQLASDHHWPLTRHGPAISRTAYLCPSQKTRVGVLPTEHDSDSLRRTADAQSGRHGSETAAHSSRRRRSERNHAESIRPVVVCQFRRTDPLLAKSFRRRASRTSNLPGSGACGRNKPCCAR